MIFRDLKYLSIVVLRKKAFSAWAVLYIYEIECTHYGRSCINVYVRSFQMLFQVVFTRLSLISDIRKVKVRVFDQSYMLNINSSDSPVTENDWLELNSVENGISVISRRLIHLKCVSCLSWTCFSRTNILFMHLTIFPHGIFSTYQNDTKRT